MNVVLMITTKRKVLEDVMFIMKISLKKLHGYWNKVEQSNKDSIHTIQQLQLEKQSDQANLMNKQGYGPWKLPRW